MPNNSNSYPFHLGTLEFLKAYASNLRGSVFIQGFTDSNLSSTVDYLINEIYPLEKDQHPNIYHLPESNIQALRNMMQHLIKAAFVSSQPRLIIIDNCHQLNLVAQNALLKNLEEPISGTHFILTSDQPHQVLATIKSRCQVITMRKPLKRDIWLNWSDQDNQILNQAYWATDGWPILLESYLQEPNSLIHREIALGKKFLQLKLADKLHYIFASTTKSAKDEDFVKFLKSLIQGLYRISRASLLSMIQQQNMEKILIWQNNFLIVNTLKTDLENQLNPKIIALNLSLKLST
ncbi:MAG: hypothetical protein OXF85_02595 [Candidatus Saccharibacteria bacterium]|nr:hypothetical protein [Candidatus Saccharibacteria bacterium]